MFVAKDDNKRHFNIFMGLLAVAAGGTGADDGIFSIWDTGPHQSFLRTDPNPQTSF